MDRNMIFLSFGFLFYLAVISYMILLELTPGVDNNDCVSCHFYTYLFIWKLGD